MPKRPQTRRSLDGLLVIGPHPLDAQLRALVAYARRTGHSLGLLWALLPGEDPAVEAPRSGFPVVAFDDEIARFRPGEYEPATGSGDGADEGTVVWHVAHPTPQPKTPTRHLPVYGRGEGREMGVDAVLCVEGESLDRQLARVEAFALRSGFRIRGVYLAADAGRVRSLLRDFGASNRARGAGATLTVGPRGEVVVHP